MAQHAEFAPARSTIAPRLDGAEQADHHGDRFHRVGHGETAIEDAQRNFADLARLGHVELRAPGMARSALSR